MVATDTTTSVTKRSTIETWIPGVHVLRTYQMGWLPRDLVARLVLSALLVPQGMAYTDSTTPSITGISTQPWRSP